MSGRVEGLNAETFQLRNGYWVMYDSDKQEMFISATPSYTCVPSSWILIDSWDQNFKPWERTQP